MKTSTASFLLLIVIYLAFISLGLPDSVFGIAWPFMRADFAMPLEAAGILTIAATIFSALSSILSGHVLIRFGTGRVTFVSCLMTALGLVGYSLAPSFLWLLPCVPLLGFGAGAIDSGLNFFVAKNYSSRHMNWLHCCWGIGATLGPVILTAFVAKNGAWRSGYLTLGSIQLSLSLVLFLSLGLWVRVQRDREIESAKADQLRGHAPKASEGVEPAEPDMTEPCETIAETEAKSASARASAMRYQILVYAIYTACEFIAGLWAFSLLVQKRGLDAATAGLWVSFYYGSLTVARFLNGLIVDRLGNRFMIKAGLLVALVGTALLSLRFFVPAASDLTAFAGLILMGAGFAPVVPCMTHETPRRFRAATAQRIIGYQGGAACLGGAILPALVGLVGARTTLEILPFVEAALIAATLALIVPLDRLTAKQAL
jgi:fucose permease